MTNLYGDEIHDDAPAIQALLDSGVSAVKLPVPKRFYYISKTLKIHSRQSLILDETTIIKLMPDSNCFMLTNAEEDASDIAVSGGIWDYNNKNQKENPIRIQAYKVSHFDGNPETVVKYTDEYRGAIMRFYKIKRLSLHDITLKDPVTYCIEMAYIEYFTVENIRFDQNLGNPTAENMDGVHVDGGCRYGSIRNVQGTCYDDIVAINADDGCDGIIENIKIDGVFGENSLRGVRLLSTKSLVKNISVSNVFGTFYQNAIGLTYFFPRTGIRGRMSHITINNIFAENALRRPEYQKKGDYIFSLIWIDGDLDINHLTISNVFRQEKLASVETLKVCKNAYIETMSLSHIVQKNETGKAFSLMTNDGKINNLYMYDIDSGNDIELINNGEIKNIMRGKVRNG